MEKSRGERCRHKPAGAVPCRYLCFEGHQNWMPCNVIVVVDLLRGARDLEIWWGRCLHGCVSDRGSFLDLKAARRFDGFGYQARLLKVFCPHKSSPKPLSIQTPKHLKIDTDCCSCWVAGFLTSVFSFSASQSHIVTFKRHKL